MKNILGLDLGVSSIGWAVVYEREHQEEQSKIVDMGVRVNPLTVDEQNDFEKGKSITTNAVRTLARQARRNLQRYKLRRDNLVQILLEKNILSSREVLHESGNDTTFSTYKARSRAVVEQISLDELSRVLLMLNKKRGYKSSRKVNNTDEGEAIDGMAIAKEMYNNNLTPGQFVYKRLQRGITFIPSFYRSDLENEFSTIYKTQQATYPQWLTDEKLEPLKSRSSKHFEAYFGKECGVTKAENKAKGAEGKKIAYQWRSAAVSEVLPIEQVVYVLVEILGQINKSSGYLGAISDRSKELYFQHLTVGQYLYKELAKNPHFSVKNKVFYRADYLDEFEKIYSKQQEYYPQLTDDLRHELRDVIIFYQRRLKSQKGLLDVCELEGRKMRLHIAGKEKVKNVGPKVCPKSSPLFQDFKVWQTLNNLRIRSIETNENIPISLEQLQRLADELTIKAELTSAAVFRILDLKPKLYELNYPKLEGNKTLSALYKAFGQVLENTGHDGKDFSKLSYSDALYVLKTVFKHLDYATDCFTLDALEQQLPIEQQRIYRLWHLLYSYEGDKSTSGEESLVRKVAKLLNMPLDSARLVASVKFDNDYGNLSTKALRKILPYMHEGQNYADACVSAGYNHSKASLTREQLDAKVLLSQLELLPRNSLRNPVVEKIIVQLINVVNQLNETYGPFDEIRLEMARELKKSAKEREQLTTNLSKIEKEYKGYREILQTKFGIQHVSHNDLLRYRLYLELKDNGYKTLYSNTFVPEAELFSKKFDIEHIIPQASLFDDSFSNKTIEARDVNLRKGNKTAMDFVREAYGDEGAVEYENRINHLKAIKAISNTKHQKLKMTFSEIPDGFLNRDLTDSQYIARKAKEILEQIVRRVTVTTGAITQRLRQDWQLIDVLKELTVPKYEKLGMVERYKDKDDNRTIVKIADWTKRNDHRHHAMDALTIAFTHPNIIHYLNHMNARHDPSWDIRALEKKILNDKKRFIAPMRLELLRHEAKEALSKILVSIKSKNKVTTQHTNVIRTAKGNKKVVQLTPRGQLHKETVQGAIQQYKVKNKRGKKTVEMETVYVTRKPITSVFL